MQKKKKVIHRDPTSHFIIDQTSLKISKQKETENIIQRNKPSDIVRKFEKQKTPI